MNNVEILKTKDNTVKILKYSKNEVLKKFINKKKFMARCSFKNNKEHGFWFRYEVVQGEKYGYAMTYNEGKLDGWLINFNYKNGKRNVHLKQFYKDGILLKDNSLNEFAQIDLF